MKNPKSGLSLIEVLFAMGILALVLTAVGMGFNQSAASSALSKNNLYAMNDAKRILEQARKRTDRAGLTGTNSVTDTTGWNTWLASAQRWQLPQATRTVTFPDGTAQDPLHIRATVSWQEKGGAKSYNLETLITKRTG